MKKIPNTSFWVHNEQNNKTWHFRLSTVFSMSVKIKNLKHDADLFGIVPWKIKFLDHLFQPPDNKSRICQIEMGCLAN